MERFRDYFFYAPSVTVYSDNNLVTCVLSTPKLNPTGHRWVSELADFNITLKYQPGKNNMYADFLSRSPSNMDLYMSECTEQYSPEVLSAILNAVETQKNENVDWISAMTRNPHVNEVIAENLPELKITKQEPLEAQKQDPAIAHVLDLKRTGGNLVKTTVYKDTKVKQLLQEWKKLFVSDDGLLMRKTETYTQIGLPETYKELVYKYLHCEMGHLGVDRVMNLARSRFYWPNMQKDIEFFITQVCKCNI